MADALIMADGAMLAEPAGLSVFCGDLMRNDGKWEPDDDDDDDDKDEEEEEERLAAAACLA